MAYNSRIKANSEIFENISFIPVGNELVLKPLIPQFIEQEALFYLANTNSPGIKRHLPSVYASDREEAIRKLLEFNKRILIKQSLFYCIRFKKNQIPIGYINLDTPLSPTGLNSWTVDFWLAEAMQGKGIMSASLYCLLSYLEDNGVPEVKALVNPDNARSINTLERVGFEFESREADGEKRLLYSVQVDENI